MQPSTSSRLAPDVSPVPPSGARPPEPQATRPQGLRAPRLDSSAFDSLAPRHPTSAEYATLLDYVQWHPVTTLRVECAQRTMPRSITLTDSGALDYAYECGRPDHEHGDLRAAVDCIVGPLATTRSVYEDARRGPCPWLTEEMIAEAFE